MTEGIVIALITGCLSLAGYVIGAYLSQSKTLYRLDQLEKKQDKHNEVIERLYEAESDITVLKVQVGNINDKLDDLEHTA